MRFHHLAKNETELSRRSIYRYFRDLGPAGIDLVLLGLADKLAVYGVTITPAEWQKELHAGRQLLEAWFSHQDDLVNPPRLVSGKDLIKELQLQPGPRLGELLEAIREAQAAGAVTSREDALQYAAAWLNSRN